MKSVGWIFVFALAVAACGGTNNGDNPILPTECLADHECQIPFPSAHRGKCGDAVENTLAAFFKCEQHGVPMLEIDTRETADGVVVIMHDGDVDRTTDGEIRFPGRTEVSQLSLEEFKSLVIDDDLCQADPGADPDRCHPPTFQEVLERTGSQTLLDVDFKDGDPIKLAEMVKSAGAKERILLFDDNLENLRVYRSVVPGGVVMPRAHNPEETFALLAPEYADLDLRWIHGDPPFAAEVKSRLQEAGVRFYCNGWDAEDPVDGWIGAAMTAETADNQELAAEYYQRAWRALDKMLQDGALALGTNFAPQYVEFLRSRYPNWLGSSSD